MGRKRQTQESINGGTNVIVSQLDYNETGQLLTKHLHSETGAAPFLQNIPYTYNERGWLRTVGSGTLFTEDLRYNNADNGISQQYNGNISEMLYSKTGVTAGITDSYSYDQLNRLTNAASSDNLTEQVSYDLMGNITALTRGGTSAATLAYTYLNGNGNSNQLATVTSSGSAYRSYGYDPNGNATSDGATKSISYNLLNLPQTVTQSSTTLATYTYDATGTKIRNTGSDGYWDYVDGIVYNGTTTANNTIQFIQTEEGRVLNQSGTWHYEYNLKDHLGNVRLSFDKDPSAGTARRIQEDEYYAFGLRAPFYNYSNNNRYLYNGKEVQTDLTNQYDYGARFYDPVVARWTTVDPLAEISRRYSPYNYVEDNPVRLTDPDGMSVSYDAAGNATYTGDDAVNFAWGQKIAGDQNQKDKDKDRKKAKQNAEQKKKDDEYIHNIRGGPIGANMTAEERADYNKGNSIGLATFAVGEGIGYLIGPAVEWIGGLFKGAEASLEAASATVEFGGNENASWHAIRHLINDAGMSEAEVETVKNAIIKDVSKVAGDISPLTKATSRTIIVNGVKISYNAFKKADGIINVGRITIPK